MTTDTASLIETLEQLEREATPGPWHVQEYGDFDTPALVVHSSDENRVCFMATPGSHGDPAKIAAGADLIVSLRNHLPSILSALKERERLRETLEACRHFIAGEYCSDEAAAMQGHPIDKSARTIWDRINSALQQDRQDMSNHQLVNGTLVREPSGIVARCICGWSSSHFSSMSASCAFRDHQEAHENREDPSREGVRHGGRAP